MSLLFNMLSRFVIVFLPRSKHLLISWMQSPSAVIFGAQENEICCCSTLSPSVCYEVIGPDAKIFIFFMLSFKPAFSLSSITLKRPFSSSLPSAIRVVSSTYLKLLIFPLAILIPACESSSPTFYMMYSAQKLNTQGDNRQARGTSYPIWKQVHCLMSGFVIS